MWSFISFFFPNCYFLTSAQAIKFGISFTTLLNQNEGPMVGEDMVTGLYVFINVLYFEGHLYSKLGQSFNS
jgi:hypothetical protein